IIVILLKWIESRYNLNMTVNPDSITSFPIFFVDTFLSAFIIITMMKKFSNFRFLNFIGRNSIVYYFICGGVPLLTGMFFRKIGLSYNGNYTIILLDFLIVVTIMTIITIIITNYFPFLIGRKKSEMKKINGENKLF
ncbi:MAG: hypothetical protein LUC88_00470, partial [Prevotella sp.]|nr:hypothetical protein [Prevotella sp.]